MKICDARAPVNFGSNGCVHTSDDSWHVGLGHAVIEYTTAKEEILDSITKLNYKHGEEVGFDYPTVNTERR